MSGGHGHGSENRGGSQAALTVVLALNLIFLVVEATAGLITGSLALLSDAAHMLTDVAALAIAVAAAWLARRPATPERSFGLVRAEVLGAFLNGLVLAGACMLIFREAVVRLMGEPPPLNPWPVIGIGALGLVINLASAAYLYRSSARSLNVQGALMHMAADALGSVGAVAAGVALIYGYTIADALASLVIGVLVLWGTWVLLRDATRVLLQFAPPGTNAGEVLVALEAVPGVDDVHELHLWSIDGREATLSAHLVLDDEADGQTVRTRVEALLRERFDIHHTTLQTEPDRECVDCKDRPGLRAVG